jgi:uncharacterized damage-inducible protein DinB
MVTVDYLRELYAYHARANQRILVAAHGMGDSELDQAPIPAHGSLRETMVHALSAEWVWLNRVSGFSPAGMLSAAEFPSLVSIQLRWEAETTALRNLIDGLTEYDLSRSVTYTRQGREHATPLWQILVHVANHGTQHRSELAAMLTALGRSPGDLDIIGYFRNEMP